MAGGGGGGGGGDCFTSDTVILMSDGTTKLISNVQIGEYVFNYNKTSVNKVTFIESVLDTHWKSLFTPTDKFPPFVTNNHPLYINDTLSALDPDESYRMYPWMGKMDKIDAAEIIPATGKIVYNLWVDGDGTYTVNGFGTSCVLGDGGFLRHLVEDGLLSHREAMDVLTKLTPSDTTDTNILHGAYLANIGLGKLHNKTLNKFLVNIRSKTSNRRPIIAIVLKLIGLVASIRWRK